jgi:hypothetical protein
MTESDIADAIDQAQYVYCFELGANTIVQSWHGGTTVNVWNAGQESGWVNTDCYTRSDPKGRAPEQDDIRAAMMAYEERVKREMGQE